MPGGGGRLSVVPSFHYRLELKYGAGAEGATDPRFAMATAASAIAADRVDGSSAQAKVGANSEVLAATGGQASEQWLRMSVEEAICSDRSVAGAGSNDLR